MNYILAGPAIVEVEDGETMEIAEDKFAIVEYAEPLPLLAFPQVFDSAFDAECTMDEDNQEEPDTVWDATFCN